jgi:small subunit ribosomal protein S19
MNKFKCKNSYVQKKLLSDFLKVRTSEKRIVFTKSRGSTIIPLFIDSIFNVYNGKFFVRVLITKEMVGYKLGEFCPTRKKFSFKKQKKLYGAKN